MHKVKTMLRLINYLFSIIIIFFFTNVFALQTQWSYGIESQVRIISPLTHNNNQNELYLGLQYKLKEGWKTYWRSPGDGGFPQNIDWSESSNIKNIEILWPIPQEFEILGMQSIGYTDEVIFPLKINILNLREETQLILDVNYLVCKDICVPGIAHLELIVPSGTGKITNNFYNIEKSLSSIPLKNFDVSELQNFSIESYEHNANISILVSATSTKIFKDTEFFLDTELGLPVVVPKINFSNNYKKVRAEFVYNKKNFVKKKFNVSVILKDKNKGFEFTDIIEVKPSSLILNKSNSLIYFFIISLIGGLILNIMPCVLPVLSIKLLSILKNPKDRFVIRRSFFITSTGIVFSFVILALSLIGLRTLGINIVWGMQFQQPIFLTIIALVLLIFTMNLFGFFEFKIPAFINSEVLQKLSNNNYSKDFFNGFFATLLATPCSAPFVGTAITVAFTQSAYTMLGIFIFMGIGMASPYLFISLFPSIAKILPAPPPC